MDMENKPRLKRLLRHDPLVVLLQAFVPLLGPEAALAVSDGSDELLGSSEWFPPETASTLWDAASAVADSSEITITEQGTAASIRLDAYRIGAILATGSLPSPEKTQLVLASLGRAIEAWANASWERRATAREALERYQEINLLYSMGETLATCLDVNELPQRVLTEASQVIHARQGAVLLYDDTEELVTVVSTGTADKRESTIEEGYALAAEVARTGKSQIVNDRDVETGGGERRQSRFLAAPLLSSERCLGVILLANKAQGEMFTASDEKLLSALAWQAAIALENARLFDSVRRQRDELTTMKSYMDNIFASIASGVITINNDDNVVTFNRAAERILRIPAHQAVNQPYRQVFEFLRYTPLPSLIEDIRQRRSAHETQEISPRLHHGEQVHLNLNLSPLLGSRGETLGVAIVLDDVSEKRRFERERALVRRYLPSGLVDWLPHDSDRLRQERRVITALFADIRGFTTFSEVTPPERVIDVLNDYLTLSEAAVRFNWGIVDKYMGDAILALFNTPLLDVDQHAWYAIRMAWTLNNAVKAYHEYISAEARLDLGFGINTGIVVVGNLGTEDRMEYTAIGDTVNLARRLQQNAAPGQIVISDETRQKVRDRVQVAPLPAMQVKGRRAFTRAYEVVAIADD
jgi:adenylate cyclase